MRVQHWIFHGLFVSVGLIPSVSGAAVWDYWGIIVHNTSATNLSVNIEWSQNGSNPWSGICLRTIAPGGSDGCEAILGTGVPGNTPVIRARNNAWPNEEFCRYNDAQSQGGGEHHWHDCYPWGAPPATTNYWCVYCINWTNTGTKYAAPRAFIVDGTNGIWEQTMTLAIVAPGVGLSRCFTNSYGTNVPPGGGCGYLIFGDGREGATVPDVTGNGTLHTGISGGPGSGSGGTATPGPIVRGPGDTNGPGAFSGGTTNLATQADIYKLGDAVVTAIGDLELSGARGFSNVVGAIHGSSMNLLTNLESQLAQIRENTYGMATNLTGFEGMVYTNLMPIGTNIIGMGTNLSDIAGVIDGLTNGAMAGVSNVLHGGTNGTWGMLTNIASSWSTNINGFLAYGSGFADGAAGQLASRGNGVAAGDAFWTLHVKGLQGEDPPGLTPINLKKYFSLEIVEDYVAGFRAWFRMILLWSTVVMCILVLARELRRSIFESLAVPPPPSAAVATTVTALGSVGGPIGAGVGAGAGLTLKFIAGTVILSGLVMLPSLMVATAYSVVQLMGGDAGWLAAQSGGVVSSAPTVLWYIVEAFSPWLPLKELCITGLNMGVGLLGLDGLTMFAMFYLKVVQV